MWPLRNYFCSFYPLELNIFRMVELCIPNNNIVCFLFLTNILTAFGRKMTSQDSKIKILTNDVTKF